MMHLKTLFICLSTTVFALLYCFGMCGFCQDYQDAVPEDSFGAVLARYSLLEDDFTDIPHRPTRFEYIKESLEDIRLYSRPDGDEFAILNLHYKDGSIFLNNVTTTTGRLKTQRGSLTTGKNRFVYKLFANKSEPIYADSFEIPLTLHYDFLNEATGELDGGVINRTETDFILKIPLADKAAQKIIFFQQNGSAGLTDRPAAGPAEYQLDGSATIIGETLF